MNPARAEGTASGQSAFYCVNDFNGSESTFFALLPPQDIGLLNGRMIGS